MYQRRTLRQAREPDRPSRLVRLSARFPVYAGMIVRGAAAEGRCATLPRKKGASQLLALLGLDPAAGPLHPVVVVDVLELPHHHRVEFLPFRALLEPRRHVLFPDGNLLCGSCRTPVCRAVVHFMGHTEPVRGLACLIECQSAREARSIAKAPVPPTTMRHQTKKNPPGDAATAG